MTNNLIPLKEWHKKWNTVESPFTYRTASRWAEEKKIHAPLKPYEIEIKRKHTVMGRMIDPNVNPHDLGLL